jgi:octaprenyl-diphosphate synthase
MEDSVQITNKSTEVAFLDVFSDQMNEYRVTVDDAISSELRRMKETPFFEPLTYALTGGKRLRPILLLLAFQSVASLERDPLPAAVAVEIIHSGSLAIDDIIDEDLTRRDIEAFHASYGLKVSLLNTEMLLSIMLDIVARCLDNRVAQVLAQAVSSLGTGAFEELAVYTTKRTIDMGVYLSILEKKTAFLFEASARMGALLAGAQKNEIDALSDYGRLLGLAYQIQDDIVDLEEDPSRCLLSFLDGTFKDAQHLQELSKSYIAEAKQRLQELKSSEAKNLLFTLADAIGKHSAKRNAVDTAISL